MKRCITGFLCLISIQTVIFAADYRMKITVDTGFFDRKNALVKTEISFPRSIDSASIRLLDKGKKLEYAFVPTGKNKGGLYWVLSGKTPSLIQKEFILEFSDGNWNNKAVGTSKILERIRNETNLIPNPDFETIVDGKKRTNWKGEKLPECWSIYDHAWAYRKLPDIKSTCRISELEVMNGKKSLEFVTQLRDDKKDKKGEKLNLIGYAVSNNFPLKPDTEYSFSYYVKFTDVVDNGRHSQAISASVNFLAENQKRIYPRNYSLNRLQVAYLLTRNPKEAYFNKWIKVENSKKTPPEVRFGQIWISGSFSGKAYIDNLVLKEISKAGKPVKVKLGKIETIKK